MLGKWGAVRIQILNDTWKRITKFDVAGVLCMLQYNEKHSGKCHVLKACSSY